MLDGERQQRGSVVEDGGARQFRHVRSLQGGLLGPQLKPLAFSSQGRQVDALFDRFDLACRHRLVVRDGGGRPEHDGEALGIAGGHLLDQEVECQTSPVPDPPLGHDAANMRVG